jgi:outer membrane protein assembly factor BamB
MARRLGWLGPALLALGVAVAALGVWYMIGARPSVGAKIDEITLDERSHIVVLAEDGGDRSFVELYIGDQMQWRAMVPTYAGRPGAPAIAWNDEVISVRVVRDGQPEIFALRRDNASKVGGIRLVKDRGPVVTPTTGPITLHDGKRSYEIITGENWQLLVAVDLRIGKVIWQREIAPVPVTQGGFTRGNVWVEQGGSKRFFDVYLGKENRSAELIGPPPEDGVPPDWPAGLDPDQLPAAPTP